MAKTNIPEQVVCELKGHKVALRAKNIFTSDEYLCTRCKKLIYKPTFKRTWDYRK